jgi:murein DD-endopeptidase MepM/ murein hydrolase activator NlpD
MRNFLWNNISSPLRKTRKVAGRGSRLARPPENWYYTTMLKNKRMDLGRKGGFLLAGLVLGGLALVVWMILGSLDVDDPWLAPSEKITHIGPRASFTLEAKDQGSGLKELRVAVTQAGQEREVLRRSFPPEGEAGSPVKIPVALDPKALGLKEGKVTLSVSAVDRSWRNFFQGRETRLTWDAEVSLVPLSVSFVAMSHLLRPGGAGLIVYRVNKPPRESGLQINKRFFPGYPLAKGPEGTYGAFFALPMDAPTLLPAELVARGGPGNEAKQSVSLRLTPRRWRADKMNLSENFLQQVAAKFPEASQGDLLKTFLEINNKLRQANHDKVRRACAVNQPQALWSGAFQRFQGKPMARFGDRRTYIFQNRAIDAQIHQGEDLASLVHSPVPAAHNGVVVMAEPLGIYGNTVIMEHGQGVFSMYSHLSRMDVKTGERVEKGKTLGLTGATGLAGGDHLHYSVMVHGDFVDPLEWWDPQWARDQVDKVWAQAGAPAAPAVAAPAVSPQPKSKKTKAGAARKRQR